MGQEDQRLMVIPALPGAQFVVVQPQFALSVGKTAFNRPAHADDPHQCRQTGLERGITQIKLPLRDVFCSPDFMTHQQPHLGPWQPVTHRQHADGQELSDDGPFVSLQHPIALPRSRGPLLDEVFG